MWDSNRPLSDRSSKRTRIKSIASASFASRIRGQPRSVQAHDRVVPVSWLTSVGSSTASRDSAESSVGVDLDHAVLGVGWAHYLRAPKSLCTSGAVTPARSARRRLPALS
jgi:hypothetical protein